MDVTVLWVILTTCLAGYAITMIYLWVEARVRYLRRPRPRTRFLSRSEEIALMVDPIVEQIKRQSITPEVRAEIDRTPAWWDKQFHQLLVRTGQPARRYGEDEYVEERTLTSAETLYIRIPAPTEYVDCVCEKCKTVREMNDDGTDLPDDSRVTPLRLGA